MPSERAVLLLDGANVYRGVKEPGVVPRQLDIERVPGNLLMGRHPLQIRHYIAEVDSSAGRAYQANQELIADLRGRPPVELLLGYSQRAPERSQCAHAPRQFLANLGAVRLPKEACEGLAATAQRAGGSFVCREKGVDVAIPFDLVDLALQDAHAVA